MMMRLLGPCCFVVAITIPVVAEEPSEDKSEALSVFQGFAANWAGLDSYDVALSIERFHVSPAGSFQEEFYRYRLFADFRRNNYLFVVGGNREEGDFDDDPRITRATRAFCYNADAKEAWIRDIPKPAQRMRVDSLQQALAISGFPDLRLIGMYEAPRQFHIDQSLDQLFETEFHVGKTIRARALPKQRMEVCVEDPIRGSNLRFERCYNFDGERLVPLSLKFSFVGDGSRRLRRKESIEWSEVGGVFLPTVVRGERIFGAKNKDDNISVAMQYDLNLEWVSVNDPLESETFSPQRLRDTEWLLDLLAIASKS